MMRTAPIRVLIVEDDALIAEDLKRRLIMAGHTVCGIASNGEEALNMAVRLRPKLVLMDIHLNGEMDGIEAAGRIRRRIRVPLVYLTAHADDETLGRAKDTEPVGYVVKPFTQCQLHSAIEMAICTHRREVRMEESRRHLAWTLRFGHRNAPGSASAGPPENELAIPASASWGRSKA